MGGSRFPRTQVRGNYPEDNDRRLTRAVAHYHGLKSVVREMNI